jgi:hypothetical protein
MKNITIVIEANLNNRGDYEAISLPYAIEKIVNDYLSRAESDCQEAVYMIRDSEGTPVGSMKIA